MPRNRLQTLLSDLRRERAASGERGFSLIEVLVASAVFLLIMLAVYQVYMRSLEGHKLGVNLADLVQSTRFGFEEMTYRIRAAGFEFDLDGEGNEYAQQSDESIEFMGARAIAVRANYDFAEEALRGRDEEYEEYGGGCCPVVTTGNDEILVFALGKDEGAPNQPTESITLYMDLDAPRDGRINSSGEIEGEETITIENVALTDLSDPPYVLYQFSWAEPSDGGALQRRPLVDNIIDLEFTYYDEGGNDLAEDANGNPVALPNGGPDPDSDPDPLSDGRNTRETVRKVKIYIRGMTPEPDLRYVDEDDPNADTRKHRKFELVQEVHTFNVGRRGQKDKDTDPPESVTNVQLCSGQCGMVRVDWTPGPPEDRITDHVVILGECPGGSCSNCYDTPLASFIVVSDLDLTVSPEREYAVFDLEDDPDLTAGTDVCARVIARDASGAESEPSDSDNNFGTDPDDYTTIIDHTRSEAPSGGQSSGYDSIDNDWPDAAPDNASGLAITTNSAEASYPRANHVEVQFDTPEFQLDRQDTDPGDLYDWTTDQSANGTRYGALEEDRDPDELCYRIDLTPDAADRSYRTPAEELAETAGDDEPNVYIFRVSGSDDGNWGPNQDDCDTAGPNCIVDPANFMPYAGNLYAAVSASLVGQNFSFTDWSESAYYEVDPLDPDPYEHRFVSTGFQNVTPDGFDRPVKAVTPGEVYYYRVRVTDTCWSDSNLDGVDDDSAGTATELTAWSTVDDFADEDTWREAAVKLSPFYPPLLSRNNSSGNRDKPADAPTHDSDAVDLSSLSSIATYALPGYAIPQLIQGNNYVRPEKPTFFYVAKVNDSGSELLPNDGGAPAIPGTRLIFNAAKRTAPYDSVGTPDLEPVPVAYSWYTLARRSVTDADGNGIADNAAQLAWDMTTGGIEIVTSFRLSEDGLRDYTIDRRSEVLDRMNSSLDNAALFLPDAATGFLYHYKLFTGQVTEELFYDPPTNSDPLPEHVDDDGITPASGSVKFSKGSRGFLYPTPFYDQVANIAVTPNNNGTNSTLVEVDISMDPVVDPGGTCSDVQSAQLHAYNFETGEWIGASDWITVSGCEPSFNETLIDQALRTFIDRARFRVEISTAAEGPAWDIEPTGARVISRLLGDAGDYDVSVSCISSDATIDCGTSGAPRILANVTDSEISMADEDRVMVLDIPITAGCNSNDFELLQLDLVLDRGGQASLPNFLYAELLPLISDDPELPPPSVAENDGANYRLRWGRESFCDEFGFCDFPVIQEGATAVTLKLRFAEPVCAPVRFEEFNFRVSYDFLDGGTPVTGELLCSNRGEFDPDNGAGAETPDKYCTDTGTETDNCGRGPAIAPEACGQSPDCEPLCEAGLCPANADFSVEPSTFLEDDGLDLDRIVRIEQVEDCSGDCALGLTEITVRFECDGERDCSVNTLPGFLSAQLVHEDMTTEALPAPTQNDTVPNDHIQLSWSGLSDLDVVPGEIFGIEFLFNGAMTDTVVETWTLQFGTPLPAAADCDWDTSVEPIDIPNSP